MLPTAKRRFLSNVNGLPIIAAALFFSAACLALALRGDRLRQHPTPWMLSRRGVLRAEVGADWLPAGAAGAASAAPPPPPPTTIADLRPHSLAQHAEDVYAHEHFFWGPEPPGSRQRVVMESGAVDGVTFSISHSLEQQLGWRAIHIEAGPGKFEALARNRPRALNLHTALCDSPRVLHFLQKDFRDSVGGIAEFMAPAFAEKFWPGVDLRALDGHPDATPISCLPVRSLLPIFGVRRVDLWVLDVEGAELAVLQTVDWAAVEIDVIALELDGADLEKDAAVWDLLGAKGYDVHSTTKGGSGQREDNTWFVRRAAAGALRAKPGAPKPGPPLSPRA